MATAERLPTRMPNTFSSPLRHYSGVWCLFVTALPVVVTQFGLIPVYESQRSLLPAYASFFCLLSLAFVFSQRHRMARAMFAPRLLWAEDNAAHAKGRSTISINGALAAMILGALCCTALYLWAFEIGRSSPTFPQLPPNSMNAVLLALSFITMFLLASASFAVVAVREHIQRVLGLSDAEVITGLPRSSPAVPSAAPAALHAGISAIPDRPVSRMAVVSDETFSSEELFKREASAPLRTGKPDQSAFERR